MYVVRVVIILMQSVKSGFLLVLLCWFQNKEMQHEMPQYEMNCQAYCL